MFITTTLLFLITGAHAGSMPLQLALDADRDASTCVYEAWRDGRPTKGKLFDHEGHTLCGDASDPLGGKSWDAYLEGFEALDGDHCALADDGWDCGANGVWEMGVLVCLSDDGLSDCLELTSYTGCAEYYEVEIGFGTCYDLI